MSGPRRSRGRSRLSATAFRRAVELGGAKVCDHCGSDQAVRGWPHPTPDRSRWCDRLPCPIDPPPREAAEEFWGEIPDASSLTEMLREASGNPDALVVIP